MRTVNFIVIFCALFLINEVFPQPGDTSTIVYAPPRDSRPDTTKPDLPTDLSPVTTPVISKDLFTVVLWSGKTETESRSVAKNYDKKGFDLKIFRGSGFKKSDFMVTTGFFKTRLDAEFLKRGLTSSLKNRKLWVKQIDSRMEELIFIPSGSKPAQTKEGKQDKGTPSNLSNTSLTSLLNTGRLIMLYGTAGDINGMNSLIDPGSRFIHTVFDAGTVLSVTDDKAIPENLSFYKRFFFSFKAGGKFDPWKAPVLVTMPDRERLMKVKKFIESAATVDESTKKAQISALNKVTRQLVLKNARIWLAKKDNGWFFAGIEEIK